MTIEPIDPRGPEVALLLAASDAYAASLYPAESNHLDGVSVLCAPHVHFLGCRVVGVLVGCGAVKTLADAEGPYGEIKRVWVQPSHRGQGLAGALMAALQAHLVQQGISRACLETGIHQPEALALYRRLGYRERAPFGDYRADPLSVFMQATLPGRNTACTASGRRAT